SAAGGLTVVDHTLSEVERFGTGAAVPGWLIRSTCCITFRQAKAVPSEHHRAVDKDPRHRRSGSSSWKRMVGRYLVGVRVDVRATKGFESRSVLRHSLSWALDGM